MSTDVIAKQRIKHGPKTYNKGETISGLKDAEAEALISRGLAAKPKTKAEETKAVEKAPENKGK